MNVRDTVEQRQATDDVNVLDIDVPGGEQNGRKPERAMAVLAPGRSVVVVGHALTLDSWIKTVQEGLAKARRAKSYGLTLEAFLKMLRDMSRG